MAVFPIVSHRFNFVVTRQETNSQRLHFICQTLGTKRVRFRIERLWLNNNKIL